MSRLEAIATRLGMTTDAASNYTRQIRRQFDAAPSYAEIMRALRKIPGRPSAQQVVAEIKQFRAGRGEREDIGGPRHAPGRGGGRAGDAARPPLGAGRGSKAGRDSGPRRERAPSAGGGRRGAGTRRARRGE
jgi:hypothetical protein